MKLFETMDSEYIKLCKINDVLDELTNGEDEEQIHPEYTTRKRQKNTG